ncbi:hypothetical protein [Rhizorhapis sp.]|uniref:hypothetical protein n=1 Tax=Rhizorhapis sp. TaxID=1968842 RepID=UPI002B4681E1|nr:hypothetical protein [Rhizorhapis sp.]HKR17727.1 hypothetical protein [Rhizorhapis sp.]
MVAVAIGTAVVGAGASIYSGNKSAKAIEKGADKSAAIEKYQYDTTRADYAPYRQVGYGALDKLAAISGVSSPKRTDWNAYVQGNPDLAKEWAKVQPTGRFNDEAEYGQWHYNTYGQGEGRNTAAYSSGGTSGTAGADYSDFYNSPGYLFRLNEGQKAIERSAAARGGLYSGATMKAVNTHAQGVASDEFNNYVARLQSLAGVGQSATGSTAEAGQAYASGASQAAQQAGAARASAYANTGNAINSAVSGAAGGLLYMQGMKNGGGQYPYGGNLGGIY